jgi:type II secretory pathway pseudopilin PulG
MTEIGPLRSRDERGLSLAEVVVTLALFGMVMAAVVTVWGKSQEVYFAGSETAEVQQNVRAAIDFMVREIRAAGRDVTVCAFDYGVASAGDPGDCTDAKRDACRCRINGAGTPCPATPYNTCANVFAIPAGEATATTLRVRADRNDDGIIAGSSDEDVKYALTSASPPCPPGVSQCITRQIGTTTTAMVAVDINGFALTYFPVPGYGPCSPVVDPCPAFTLPLSQLDADRIGRVRIVVTAVQPFAGQSISRTLTTDVVLRNRS